MSVASDVMEAGGLGTFNLDHGFPEAVVRGFRSGFLTDYDYHHLTQCESLEDMKMNLQETDYDQFMANEQHIIPVTFRDKALQKLVQEMEFLRAHAVEPLATFLDYISYEFMIDNVMLLLKGTLSGRSANELIKQCHPLGLFKESTMRSIPAFEASPKGYADLYQTVLIDTPVGPYFSQYLQDNAEQLSDASEMRNILEEVQIEVIKNSLHKLYLEDFYRVCQAIGGETAEFMGHLIKLRADRMAVNIAVNSIGTPLNEPAMRSTRQKLFPAVGYLYPAGTARLAEVTDEGQMEGALSAVPEYQKLYASIAGAKDKTLEDLFYEKDVQALEVAFEGQMHFAPFYAYVKLKQQEIRNLVWIAECILQGQKDEINKFVPIFSDSSPWRLAGKLNR